MVDLAVVLAGTQGLASTEHSIGCPTSARPSHPDGTNRALEPRRQARAPRCAPAAKRPRSASAGRSANPGIPIATLRRTRGEPISRDEIAADRRVVGVECVRSPSLGRSRATPRPRTITRSPKLSSATCRRRSQSDRPHGASWPRSSPEAVKTGASTAGGGCGVDSHPLPCSQSFGRLESEPRRRSGVTLVFAVGDLSGRWRCRRRAARHA